MSNKMINVHDKFLQSCEILSKLSKCVSHKVASMIVRDSRVLSIGINCTLPGVLTCSEVFENYNSSKDREEHHSWSLLNESHAEEVAIVNAAKFGIIIDDSILYSLYQPCSQCMRNALQAGIKHIMYRYDYDKFEIGDTIRYFISRNNIKVEKIVE